MWHTNRRPLYLLHYLWPYLNCYKFILAAEKRRVAILKEWFRKNNSLCVDPKDVTMLSSINSDGVYNVLCKVIVSFNYIL